MEIKSNSVIFLYLAKNSIPAVVHQLQFQTKQYQQMQTLLVVSQLQIIYQPPFIQNPHISNQAVSQESGESKKTPESTFYNSTPMDDLSEESDSTENVHIWQIIKKRKRRYNYKQPIWLLTQRSNWIKWTKNSINKNIRLAQQLKLTL